MVDTRSNGRCPTTIENQQTHRSIPESDQMGEFRQCGFGVREVGNADFDGNNAQHATATDHFEVKGVVEESKISDVKSALLLALQTGHALYYSQGFQKW
jgi:hypothetical protein